MDAPTSQGRHVPEAAPAAAAPHSLAASYVVRIWVEPPACGGAPAWRGQVVHVQSGESTYFANVRKLLFFIAAHGVARFGEKEVGLEEDTVQSESPDPGTSA